MKELGLMQRDYPDIVTAVKTKQVVQTVLNTATETLKVLISSGIVDKNEEAKLQKMILQKKKKTLGTLPSTIAPPTAEELLHSISWLENEKKQIEFIQKRARILCYDYGDIICEEHEMPEGIHLIISGMTKFPILQDVVCLQQNVPLMEINQQQLCGSSPSYGVANDVYELRNPKWVPYTDYLVSGAIIGELNCLTKQEMEYTVTCETAVQVSECDFKLYLGTPTPCHGYCQSLFNPHTLEQATVYQPIITSNKGFGLAAFTHLLAALCKPTT
ncbi:sodium/hydrogen exchanger 11-like [Mauremys reevesii]|uniref:sodium/hydrogen exchanger 11-like n=1 Tax=Mauremys reevesii TaxID=260615 RepID=UPI00193F801C|nr:sodium/hydrogen exchanger 11-like [Mauremys reevesii]